jgi:hypothetical protein
LSAVPKLQFLEQQPWIYYKTGAKTGAFRASKKTKILVKNLTFLDNFIIFFVKNLISEVFFE